MIKLILSDVDGTLLPKGDARLSDSIFDMIHALSERGVIFAAASGRTYHELLHLFAPVAGQIYFICMDGALLVRQGRVLYQAAIPPALSAPLLKAGCPAVLSGMYRSYYLKGPDNFETGLLSQYRNHAVEITDLCEIRENIYKIALYGQCAPPTAAGLYLVYHRPPWREWVLQGIDKGSASVFLQQRLCLSKQECAAFGDAKNDLEMLRQAGCRFAMADAAPQVKALCGRRAERVDLAVEKLITDNRRYF